MNIGCAIVFVAVAVSDVRAAAVIEFDFETMADVAGVVDSIEIVNGSVGDAGGGLPAGENE